MTVWETKEIYWILKKKSFGKYQVDGRRATFGSFYNSVNLVLYQVQKTETPVTR
jgi:hypothetical protein